MTRPPRSPSQDRPSSMGRPISISAAATDCVFILDDRAQVWCVYQPGNISLGGWEYDRVAGPPRATVKRALAKEQQP
jgi:hypothetical protein